MKIGERFDLTYKYFSKTQKFVKKIVKQEGLPTPAKGTMYTKDIEKTKAIILTQTSYLKQKNNSTMQQNDDCWYPTSSGRQQEINKTKNNWENSP